MVPDGVLQTRSGGEWDNRGWDCHQVVSGTIGGWDCHQVVSETIGGWDCHQVVSETIGGWDCH